MCVVLLPNIGISTSISNNTLIRPQTFANLMCVHWECAWCQCQILVLALAYSTLHKYAKRTSETSCVSTGNVRGAIAKYWYQHQHIQQYTNTPTDLRKLHVCPLGMCVVLVPNIGISTSIFNTTQIRKENFRNFMCVHWECVWCQCQILVLTPAYPTLHKYAKRTSETSCVSTGNVRGGQCQILVLAPAYPTLHKNAHSTSETSCVSSGNVRGASVKYWYQHQHIQHYTNTPTDLHKLHVCPLGMCVVLVPNIGISTSISNTTHIRPQLFRNFMCVHWECAWCQCQILVLAPAYRTLLIYVTALEKLHVCPLGMCVVLVPNIGIRTSIFNTTQILSQHFQNFMCVHWECVWCQCQILVLAPAYPTLHIYVTALEKLHVCPLGMCVVLVPNIGISTSISNNTLIRPQTFANLMCVHWECAWCQCQILVLAPAYSTLHKYAKRTSETSCVSTGNVRGGQCQILVLAPAYPTLHKNAHSTSETSCVSSGNVRGASVKYWYQHQHIQHYTNTPTDLHKLHVCPLGMCVVLVPNIGISTSISNTTHICPQLFRNFMCVHWECAWCQCQILVLAPAYRTLLIYVTALEKLHVCPLGMCVVLVPNIGISTSISNTTHIRHST